MSVRRFAGVVAAVVALSVLARAATAAESVVRRALHAKLRGSGRAEVALRVTQPDPLGGRERVLHATLALEPPNRARLEIAASGEKLTMRGDGGEWLQPRAKQVLRLRPEHGALALRWWQALLDPGASWSERRLPDGRWRVVLRGDEFDADSTDVTLGADGLPARLDRVGEGGGSYRLSGWRFVRSRGEASFRLRTPPGFEAVDLP